MASGGGVDPAEAESKLFAVTDSLIDAGLAPSIHVGRGISVSASTRTTVRAEVETEEGEETFVFELPKTELWRAVVLIDEYGRGPGGSMMGRTRSRLYESHCKFAAAAQRPNLDRNA